MNGLRASRVRIDQLSPLLVEGHVVIVDIEIVARLLRILLQCCPLERSCRASRIGPKKRDQLRVDPLGVLQMQPMCAISTLGLPTAGAL